MISYAILRWHHSLSFSCKCCNRCSVQHANACLPLNYSFLPSPAVHLCPSPSTHVHVRTTEVCTQADPHKLAKSTRALCACACTCTHQMLVRAHAHKHECTCQDCNCCSLWYQMALLQHMQLRLGFFKSP